MELSKRLKAIADMVEEKTSADIGTDHGYLPIYLIKEKGLERVIACDVNKGPLKKAEENISAYNVGEMIETRLGNGLEKVMPGEAECITISGMGGMLIISILKEGIETVKSASHLILQPQHDIPRVREYIMSIGFKIDKEDMLIDEGKYYTIISAVKGEDTPYNEVELMFGRKLIETKNVYLRQYLEHRAKKLETIALKIKEGGSEDNDRLKDIYEEHRLCKEVAKWL
ncbi:MAG: SAM-dependent methyltransferase [Lachnospiraceae bacterium]|nr:SAM-dependent methyltransferase [Lachnospiraceae bacterium]